jgi:hypothetical protein
MSNTHTASATFRDGSKRSEPFDSKSTALAQINAWLAEGATSTRVSPTAPIAAKRTIAASRGIPAWAIPTIEN